MPKKIAPFVKDPELKRALNDVYNDINSILGSTEYSTDNGLHSTSGRVGDIKAIKDYKNNSYKIAGKTPDGWITTPAYLQVGDMGRNFNVAEFNLLRHDNINYKDSIFTIFSSKNDINPSLRIGSSTDEGLKITSVFQSGTQLLNYATITTVRNKASFEAIKIGSDGALTILEDSYSTSSSSTKVMVFDSVTTGLIKYRGIDALVSDAGVAIVSNNADNRVITGGSGTALNGEANLTFDGTDLIIASTGKLAVGDNATYVYQSSDSNLAVVADGGITLDAAGDIELNADGDQVVMKWGGATGQIDFTNENSGDGVIQQKIDGKDLVIKQYGGNEVIRFTDGGDVKFTNTAYFAAQPATGDGTTTIDWTLGNKFHFAFGAQNETITFGTNPDGPCNLLLLLKQDATGSRTVDWEVTSGTIYWANGGTEDSSEPLLTTTATNTDIISFYFDGFNYFGVASLNFET